MLETHGLKSKINNFKKLINANITQEDIKRVCKNHLELNKEEVLSNNISELCNWFDNCLEFFNRLCIQSQDTFYSTDKKYIKMVLRYEYYIRCFREFTICL